MRQFLVTGLILLLASCQKSKSGETRTDSIPASIEAVQDIEPKSLLITPGSVDLALGESLDLSLTGIFPYKNVAVIENDISWSSSNDAVATINELGIVKAKGLGETTIQATYRGKSEDIGMKVREAEPMQIILIPNRSEIVLPRRLAIVQSKEFSLESLALQTDGQLKSIASEVEWSSSDADGLEIKGSDRFIAHREGTYEINAKLGRLTAKHTVTVSAAPVTVARLELMSDEILLRLGDKLNLPIRAVQTDESLVSDLSTAQFSASDELITFSGMELTAGRIGRHTVTAKFGGQSLSFPVVVRDAEIVGLEITPESFPLSLGQAQSFSATVRLSNGASYDISSSMTVAVSHPAVSSLSGHTLTGLSLGTSTLTVSYKGHTQTALINVGAATLKALDIRPNTFTLSAGLQTTFQVFGIYTDGGEQDITNLVTSRTIATTRADVPSAGTLLGKSEGSTRLSATYVDPVTTANLSTSVPVTVTSALLQSIVFDPPTSSVALGRFEDFRIKGRYSDQTEVDITHIARVTADITTAPYSYCATITLTGANRIRVQGISTGSQKIFATLAGVTGEVVFTSTPKELDRVDIERLDTNVATGQMDKGTNARFIARGTYSDLSTENLTLSSAGITVTWNNPDPTVGTLTTSGNEKVFTAIKEGDGSFSVSVVDNIGTKSSSFNLNIYVPCSGAGKRENYYCWYLGANGQSCQQACTGVGRNYHAATNTFAGFSGSDDQCRNLIQDVFQDDIQSTFNPAATATNAIGCAIFVDNDLNIGLRQKALSTTDTAAQANFRRICSCE